MCCYAANLRLTHLTFNKGDYRPLYSIVLFYIVCFSSLKLMIVKSRSELCHTCFFTQIFLYKLFNVRYPLRKELSMSSTFSYIFNFVLCVFFFLSFFWLVYVAWYVTCSNWSNFLSYIFITYGF